MHLKTVLLTGFLTLGVSLTVLTHASIASKPQLAREGSTLKAEIIAEETDIKKAPSLPDENILPVLRHPDIKKYHQIIANQTLRALRSPCINTLKTFHVRYDNPKHRGLSGRTSIVLDGSVPLPEFRALLLHEFAHITDVGCNVGNTDTGASIFKDGSEILYNDDPSVSFYSISWVTESQKKESANDEDFVSGYAKSDAFEDFAESYVYFMLQEDAFAKRAQENAALAAKLKWFRTNPSVRKSPLAKGQHNWTGRLPWDTTKLPYIWYGRAIAMQ
jgi:hypothetical protein